MDAWLIWLIIAVVLLVVEMLTITAAVGMLGVAALITAGFAALGLPVAIQLLAFTVTATIGVLLIRPVVRRAAPATPAKTGRGRSTTAVVGPVMARRSWWCRRQQSDRVGVAVCGARHQPAVGRHARLPVRRWPTPRQFWSGFVPYNLMFLWSCRESNPLLYQAFCRLPADSFRLVPVQSRSLPAVSFSGLDGVKSGHLIHRAGRSRRGGEQFLQGDLEVVGQVPYVGHQFPA